MFPHGRKDKFSYLACVGVEFLQDLPNKWAPGCENRLSVIAHNFSLAMAAKFSQPGFVAWSVGSEGSAE